MTDTLREGIKFFRMKQWDRALRKFLEIDAASSGTAENRELAYYLGLCYTKLKRYDDAMLYLEQVITAAADPLRVCQCRMTLAYIYLSTERAKMAEFELSQLVKNGFKSVQIYTTLAYAAWAQDQHKKAIELYEKALELDKENTTAMNGLGYILADTDTDTARGLQYCLKAADKKPDSPAYLDSVGWAYFKSGKVTEARNWLRKALDLAPDQAEIKGHMRIVVREK